MEYLQRHETFSSTGAETDTDTMMLLLLAKDMANRLSAGAWMWMRCRKGTLFSTSSSCSDEDLMMMFVC